MTLLEVHILDPGGGTLASHGIAANAQVVVLQVIPTDGHQLYKVEHLPAQIETFLNNAIRVLNAGVPDAAAVQLRKTLEAAAALNGIKERVLVSSIEKLIAEGLITREFGKALHHIRKIGNTGAHYADEQISRGEAEVALRFTVAMLRNLFEVPGELAIIEAEEDTGAFESSPELPDSG